MERIWSARFNKSFSSKYLKITTSFPTDFHLLKYECWSSAAHIRVLMDTGEINFELGNAIIASLKEAENLPECVFKSDDEDIHTCIEKFLNTQLGHEVAGYISMGRSRNTEVNVITSV